MHRLSFATWAAPFLALLSLTQPVSAGPIEWSYRVRAGTANGTPELYLGAASRGFNPDHGEDDYYGAFNRPNPVDISGMRSGSWLADSDPLQVGQIVYPELRYFRMESDLAAWPHDTRWRVTLDLTDAASGQSGSVDLLFHAGIRNDIFDTQEPGVMRWGPFLPFGTPNRDGRSLVLGENQYDVRLFGREFEGWSPLLAEVRVTSLGPSGPPVDSPEPGTFVMAGLGLSALGLIRWQLRWVDRPDLSVPRFPSSCPDRSTSARLLSM